MAKFLCSRTALLTLMIVSSLPSNYFPEFLEPKENLDSLFLRQVRQKIEKIFDILIHKSLKNIQCLKEVKVKYTD